MLTLCAYVDVPFQHLDQLARWWPVAAAEPGGELVLDGDCTEAQAALFVALVAVDRLDPLPATRRDAVAQLIAREWLSVPGGTTLTDTATGVTIRPGCCCGLDDWTDWDVAFRDTVLQPGFGHDPGPFVERRPDSFRVWQDGGAPLDLGPGIGDHVDVSRAELARLVRGVARDLAAFRAVLDRWARSTDLGGRGAELVRRLDEAFALTTPDLGAVTP